MKGCYKIITFCLLGGFCGSWRCDSPEPQEYITPIYYYNHQNQDLLDPATPGHFDQSGIVIGWTNPDGSIGSSAPKIYKGTSIPSFPGGYYISKTGVVDNNGNDFAPTVVFIHLNKTIVDTLDFDFVGSTLQRITVNKTLISPLSGMNSYPYLFPVIITK